MFSRCPFVRSYGVGSYVCHQTSEHDILKTSEPIVMQIATSHPWGMA